MSEDRERGFFVVLTKKHERYLVDTYSAATAAFIVESQFGEEVDSVHTTEFKKILLMGAGQNGSTENHIIETPVSYTEGETTSDEPTSTDQPG